MLSTSATRIRGHAPNKLRCRYFNSIDVRLFTSLASPIPMSFVVNSLPSRRLTAPSTFSCYGFSLFFGAEQSLFSMQPNCYCNHYFSYERRFYRNRSTQNYIVRVKDNETSHNIVRQMNFSTNYLKSYLFSKTRGQVFSLSSGRSSFSSFRFCDDGGHDIDHQNDTESLDLVSLGQSRDVGSANNLASSNSQINDENSINENETASNLTTTSGKNRHCNTCTCYDTQNITQQQPPPPPQKSTSAPNPTQPQNNHQQTSNQPKTCQLPTPLIQTNTPLPPPLPKPTYSFYQRVLPKTLTSFTSLEGKTRFAQSLQSKHAESYFPLSQQFLTQMDPAYCGISTLVLVLNALAMDPNVRWRGGWRWYGDESMLLERCCLEEERVRREGITLEEFGGLARCQGVNLVVKRPLESDGCDDVSLNDEGMVVKSTMQSEFYGIDEFRRDIIMSVQMPPRTRWDDDEDENDNDEAVSIIPSKHLRSEDDGDGTNIDSHNGGGYFLVTSFARYALHQTGDGHFSPIAAYHASTDSCLILDVARFKYIPYWVSVKDLYDAMIPKDSATGRSRGWVLMFPPTEKCGVSKNSGNHQARSIEAREGKRPAVCVPLTGSGIPICPVEGIKVEYCSVRHHSTDDR
mmetsp:Transcript_5015/g.10317  ORF Transcript_5015/g.10317 Transcript_5015/m.10317 type:complete len:630 (+) Transcript_5015:68-1957(+)